MSTFFTSDLHFSHRNIIDYCKRPFADIEVMNRALIDNWNARVTPSDNVFIIGDVHMGDKNFIPQHVDQLNGNLNLVIGNHDLDRRGKLHRQFTDCKIGRHLFSRLAGYSDELYLTVDNTKLYLRHEPKMDWVADSRSQYHLCGHVHDSWRRLGDIINVGVDVWNYRPVTLAELLTAPQDPPPTTPVNPTL